jgi:hypothetical protein
MIVSYVTGCDYNNKLTVLIEVNGKKSSSKRTRHLNIRYFLVTDAVAKQECKVSWIPCEGMYADYMTKAQSGLEFCRMGGYLMGAKPA